jgi:hypothetical protein
MASLIAGLADFGDLWLRYYNATMRKGVAARFFRGSFIANIVLGICIFASQPATAQETTQVALPSAPANPPAKPAPPPTHAFWDRTNLALFSGIVVTRGMDYASTRNFQARGRQEILLPDDVVNNSAGFASLEAAATMTSVGVSYLLHRTGHHKLERWLSIGHIGVTAFGDVRNYALESKHH